MSSERKNRLVWTVVLCAMSVLVLLDVSNTIAQKRDRSVNPILIDRLDEPAPAQNSVVGICQSTDAALPSQQPLNVDLSTAEVDAMSRLAVQRAGGLADVIQPGDWVTIKVNILRYYGQSGYSLGIATDLRVVRSVIQQLIEEGDASRITVVEGKQWRSEEGGWQVAWPEYGGLSYAGMIAELQAANQQKTIDYIDLDIPPYTTSVPVPGGGLSQASYTMPDAILNCDRLIAIAVMKTHTWARVTLANKLYIGATPASFYNTGQYGGSWDHGGLPHGPLDRTICDLVSYHPADLAIVEGIWGIQGNGPAGDGAIRRNVVIASKDIVAVDAVSAAAMGFNPWDIDYLHFAHNKGFGIYDLDYITVNGPSIQAVRYDFAKPRRDDPDPGYASGSYQGRSNRTWLVNGLHDGVDLENNYLSEDEATIAPVAGDISGGRTWTAFSDIDDYMDLQTYFSGSATNCITYAFTRILADQPMSVNLRFGSDDGIRVWLNGTVVYTNANTGPWALAQQTVAVALVQGENRLLVKIKNTTGAYGFNVAVSEADGDTPFGIRYSLAPTPAPEVVLNAPLNAAWTPNSYMSLNATVTDPDNDALTVRFYGGLNNPNPTDLIGMVDTVQSGSLVSYNWNAPLMPLDANTVALWHYDEYSGSIAYDAAPNAHNGVINQARWVSRGKFGPCLYFDGLGNVNPAEEDFVLSPDAPDLDGMEQITLEAWIYVASPLDEPYYAIFKKWGPNTNPELWSYAMVVMQDRTLYWHLITDRSNGWGTYGVTVISQTQIPLYQWVHVCGTYDGSMIRLYINGVADTGPRGALPYQDPVQDTPVGVHVGAAPYLNAQYFHGFIDEPRIMDRALTAEEVAERVRLRNGRYYWRAEVSDGVNVVQSEVRYFDIGTVLPQDPTPPEVTLNSPVNGYTTTSNNVALSADVSDENPMTVRFYGNSTDASDLLYAQENVSSGTVTYTWRNPMPLADVNTRSLWHFSEGGGTSTSDKTSYNNDGTLYGGAAWTTDARFGYALDFDGVDDYVEVADNGSVPLSGPMTVEAWIKPGGAPIPYSEIVDREPAGGGGGYSFILNSDRRLHLWVGDGTDWTNTVGTTLLLDDVWYYVVGVADGSMLRVYVNGVQEGTPTAQGAPTNTNPVTLRIGRGCGALLRWFNGTIDEVRISNRALTPAEIAVNYASGLPEGTYLWNVAASDGQNETVSEETRTFYIGTGSGPIIPTLMSPADLAVIADDTPTFTWSATAGVGGTYTLQYATDAGFTSGLQTISGIGEATYTVPGPNALADNTYYWHVQAFDAGNNSRGYQATPFSFQLASPTPPEVTLNSPPDNFTTTNPYMDLDFTVTDPGDAMTVWVYGDMADASDLLYVRENVAGTDITYNWTAPVPTMDGNTAGLWHFNENTGTTGYDETVNNNDGTISGPAWTADGRFGYALDFDGVNDYVQVPANASLNITGPITIEAWIKPSGTPVAYSEIVDKEGGSGGSSFILHSNRRIHFWVGDGTDWTNSEGTTALQDDVWYYVVGVNDGSAIRVYVNGVQEGPTTPQGPPGSTAGVNLQIGRGGSTLQRWFNGIIDEVRISNRALTPEEIAANYKLGDGRYCWKVTASDGISSTTSEPSYFNIGAPSGPPIPALVSPPDLAVTNDNTPTFTWSATAGVDGTYTLQYATDAGFTSGVQTISGIVEATYTVPDPEALADNTYYWHVQAFAGSNSRGYQPTPFSFGVDTTPPVITLISPPDDGTTMNPYMDLDFSVTDPPDALTVWVYGDTDDASDLLYVEEGFVGTNMTYSWTALPLKVDAGAVGLWHFDEGAGGSVSDETAYDNDGAISGAAWTADGRFGYALRFDGVNDAVIVPDADELDGMSQLTLEAWIYLAIDPTDWMAVIQKWAPQSSPPSQYTYTMVVSATNRLYAHIFTDTDDALLTGDLEIPLYTWTHVAATYDGAVVRLYVNGVQDPVTGTLTGTVNSTGRDVNIGACLPYDSEYFNGMIDEVRILTRALTPEEIAADVEQLPLGAYYWKVVASDGANTATSATRHFDVAPDTQPPVVTLNYPPDYATTLDNFMELSAGVTDQSAMTVEFYGDKGDGSDLLYVRKNVPSSDITYNWTAPVLEVGGNTAALWHFNENTGTTGYDETANNNDGTISGATWTADGRFGYGLDFDGLNDYVQVPANPSLNITGPITIEAWIRPSGIPVQYSEIVDKELASSSPGYSFILNNDRRIYFYVGESGTDWAFSVGGTQLQDNTWYYVVGIADGSEIRVYVNGVQDGPATAQGPPGSTAGVNLQIGRGAALARWFNGIIDEVRISNRALTPEEIAANFELGDGRYYWKVTASHGIYSTTSETSRFNVGIPPIPTLLSPLDGPVITDNTPTFTWSATAGSGGTYTLEYALDAGFTSGVQTIGGLGAATYTVPGPNALADNTYYWHVQAVDQWSNPSGYQAVPFSFSVDAVAPLPPTSFTVRPGHEKCKLSWTNPSGGDFAGVMIRRNPWSTGAYPEYKGAPLGYPAGPTDGTEVYTGTVESFEDAGIPRNVYYYTVFSFDGAGNYSAASPAVQGRATSYWLGDVDADGYVRTQDVVTFSSAFGSYEDGEGWDNDCDFGPSDDYSRFGVPDPDGVVDFEDLIILAMNFGNVEPLSLDLIAAGRATAAEDLEHCVAFEIAPAGNDAVSIILKNRAATLKGVRLVVEVVGGELTRVERGSLFAGHSDLFFGAIRKGAAIDVCAAALGVEAPLKASGEIARLVIKATGSEAAVVRIKGIDLRNVDNEKTEIALEGEYETPFMPTATALMQNFPNPFNPSTTLTFDMAQAGHVTIQIYSVSGRLIRTLVDERRDAGRHRVEWNGMDTNGSSVPSGIYFYRMKASGYEATKKMILVR